MKNKKINYLLFIIIASILVFIILNYRNIIKIGEDKEVIPVPYDVILVNLSDNHDYIKTPFSAKYKVIVYIWPEAIYQVLPGYIHYISKYHDIGFIFYFTKGESYDIKQQLEKIKFKYNVYIDLNHDHPYKEYPFIGFIVDENNRVIDMTNPTLPSFRRILDNCVTLINVVP